MLGSHFKYYVNREDMDSEGYPGDIYFHMTPVFYIPRPLDIGPGILFSLIQQASSTLYFLAPGWLKSPKHYSNLQINLMTFY